MKRVLYGAIMFSFISSMAFAQTTAVETVELKGVIIDNMCASAKPEGLADFVKTHTKQCVLMADRQASGYSIFVDEKLTRFDKESTAKIVEFLSKEDSKLTVVVMANKAADELILVSIKNQE